MVFSPSEKKIILLMILNGEDWHHLAVAKLPSLLWEVTSKIRFTQKLAKNKNYLKVRDHRLNANIASHLGHSIWNLRFNVSKEIPVIFHNGSNYDHNFMIKELTNKFEGLSDCLRKILESTKLFLFC